MLQHVSPGTAGYIQTNAVDPYVLKVRAQWSGICASRVMSVRDDEQHAIVVSSDALQVSGCEGNAVRAPLLTPALVR